VLPQANGAATATTTAEWATWTPLVGDSSVTITGDCSGC